MEWDLILNGSTEFYPKLNNKTYYILKVDNKEKISKTISIIDKFSKKSKSSKNNYYVGIDFEFNKVQKSSKDVALMQINLESDDSNIAYIFVLYPPEFKNSDLDIIKNLISEPKIIKILHGAESLDIPYIFFGLLEDNNLIQHFCINLYDTKFLCDYAHISENIKARCSIYYLLTENRVITQDKFDELESIEDTTGPIYEITIDIHNMEPGIFKYSLYDVIYLPELIKKYINKGIVYEKIIPQTTSLMYKGRKLIESELVELEKYIAQLNLHFIYDGGKEITLHEIWECYFYFIDDSDGYLSNLKQIQSLKRIYETLTKLIIYSIIIELFPINKSKHERIYLKQNYFNHYFIWLGTYPDLNKLFCNYWEIVNNDIRKIINKIKTTKKST